MTTPDPLQCTFEDARRTHLRTGIALRTRAKVAFFEEMVTFAVSFGARDRLAGRRARQANGLPGATGDATANSRGEDAE